MNITVTIENESGSATLCRINKQYITRGQHRVALPPRYDGTWKLINVDSNLVNAIEKFAGPQPYVFISGVCSGNLTVELGDSKQEVIIS